MKHIIQQFTAAAALMFATVGAIPQAHASNITLDGSGHYLLGYTERYYGAGTAQTGRYQNLGADYYHKVEYGIDYLTNHSSHRTGSMSFEFWAMPFYGANSGIILMTRGLDSLPTYGSVTNLSRSGLAISLNARRFPEIDLWELTYYGWKFRDAFSFSQRNLL